MVHFSLMFLALLLPSEQVDEAGLGIKLSEELFTIEGDLGVFEATINLVEQAPGLHLVKVRLSAPKPAQPPEFELKWRFPSVDINAYWNTSIRPDRINYHYTALTSRATTEAPVLSFYNNRGINRFTYACSDALRRVDVRGRLREEDAYFYCSLGFFREKDPATTRYEVDIRIDTRARPYYETLADVSEWWASLAGYKPAAVPDAARQPMYSTWYSFHQNLVVEEVIDECRRAKELGFEAVIVDDGWQTLDSKRGYAYTGDWKPERIPDFAGFVKHIHDLDMKFLLWYSLPFIGEKSGNFERFRGKYLFHWKEQGAYVLDPRYPEVREFIIGTYEKALRDWNLDGFKLDFIGRFRAREDTVLTAEEGRDIASVNRAVDVLMTDIITRLHRIKPDIMIEFRQRYIGPLMRKYGNMFRGVDCPNNGVANRVETTDLRLLSGSTAVHSDMFMWHEQEPVESAALQILNILFSVPQLSVRLDKIPPNHLEMVRFWIDYWKANRRLLLDGTFKPSNPAAMYPELRAVNAEKTIIALYDTPFTGASGKEIRLDVVNATGGNRLVLDLAADMGSVELQTYDCRGKQTGSMTRILKAGLHKFTVPESGLLTVRRK